MTANTTERARTSQRVDVPHGSAPDGGVGATVRDVADRVAGVAGEVTATVPGVVDGMRAAATEANGLIQEGSDGTLRLAAAGLIGFTVALIAQGANRIFVLTAVIPTALILATLFARAESGPRRLQDR